MNQRFLGIDTSNYRTSAALVSDDGFWVNQGQLLQVADGQIGLRQSDAVFQHTLHLHKMLGALPSGYGKQVRAVGVSTRPRAVEGSYMPCFLVGQNTARSIAHCLDVPVYEFSHQQGHLAAAAFSAGELSLLDKPFLAWHLSGGTTELLSVYPDAEGIPCATRIGGTTDIAAGQLVDRVGNLLGLSFPAGAELDQLASDAEPVSPFPVKVADSQFSLSGMQNKAEQLYRSGVPAASVARFTIETIGYAIARATDQALKRVSLPLLCAGGVMSNSLLQDQFVKRYGAKIAQAVLSGDNAVGVAVLAARRNGAL